MHTYAVHVRIPSSNPGEDVLRYFVHAGDADAAAAAVARLFGADRIASVERVPAWKAGRTVPAALRADLITAIRDFTAAGVRPSVVLRRAVATMPKRQAEVVNAWLAAVDAGAGIGRALHMVGFPEAEARLVEAGEETGRLAEMCDAALDLLRSQEELASALRRSAFYPAVVVVFIGALGALFRWMVFPAIGKIFAEIGQPMPPAFSVIPPVMMGFPFAVAAAVASAVYVRDVRERAVRLPGVRRLFWLRDMLACIQSLISSHRVGESTDRAFRRAAALCVTERARQACEKVAAFMRGDVLPGETMRGFQEAAVAAGFEHDFAFIYGAGLDSGRAEESLERLLVRYEMRLREFVAKAERAIEMILLLATGAVVGIVAGTFYGTVTGAITKLG